VKLRHCQDWRAARKGGHELRQLKGERKGIWSVWVSGNYRLTFEIEGEDATNVDFEDYH